MQKSCQHQADLWCADCVETYAEERVKEALDNDHKHALDVSGFVEKARAEGLEEAAGIVQDWAEKYPDNSEEKRCRLVMATEIRALKEKP